MGFFNSIIKSLQTSISSKEKFNEEQYNNYNNVKINEFTNKYDLTTKEGIKSIPISEATKYSDVNSVNVVYMPEQILNRKATEYKKEKNYDLAIECLKKANELLPFSPFNYTRLDYERLVDFMILAGRFDEAKEEHKYLDEKYGTRLDELHFLQEFAVKMNSESREEYQKRVIDPYIEEQIDREQYYWLLENLPFLAPKNFSAFRRIKNLKSDSYNKIVDKLRQDGIEIDKIKFWKI